MPSPLAHGLTGFALAWIGTPAGDRDAPVRRRAAWLLAGGFLAVAPDLDFVAGLVAGSINAFHGGPSHSLAAVGLVAAALACLPWSGVPRGRAVVVLAGAYASHVLLDLFSGLPGEPNDLPLLWPLTATEYHGPWQPFPGILHGRRDADFGGFLAEFLSAHNARAAVVELAFGVPLLLGAVLRRRRGTRSTTGAQLADEPERLADE